MDKAVVTKLVSREVAKVLIDCARISAELDERESRLPIIVFGEHHERDAIRLRREELSAIISELRVDRFVEKVMPQVDRLVEKRRAEEGGLSGEYLCLLEMVVNTDAQDILCH
jgi:hypothetical protein